MSIEVEENVKNGVRSKGFITRFLYFWLDRPLVFLKNTRLRPKLLSLHRRSLKPPQTLHIHLFNKNWFGTSSLPQISFVNWTCFLFLQKCSGIVDAGIVEYCQAHSIANHLFSDDKQSATVEIEQDRVICVRSGNCSSPTSSKHKLCPNCHTLKKALEKRVVRESHSQEKGTSKFSPNKKDEMSKNVMEKMKGQAETIQNLQRSFDRQKNEGIHHP